MAAWAIVAPVRADVFLTFATLNSPPTSQTNAISSALTQASVTPSTGLTMNVGDVRYVAVCLNANAVAPGAVQTFWNGTNTQGDPNQLVGFGMNMTFDHNFADNPFIVSPTLVENNPNLRIQAAGAGFANAYPNQPYPNDYRQHVALSTGGLTTDGNFNLAGGPGSFVPISAWKIVATAPGTTSFVFSRLTSGPGGALQNTWQIPDDSTMPPTNRFLDPEVFSALHQNFSFPVTVLPEPSSMALCGLAVVGFGWRKLRRKNTVVA